MLNQLRPAIVLLVVFAALLGVAYPYAVTGIAQAVLPQEANGSLIEKGGQVIGSSLIGQDFTQDKYFWPRPSATLAPDPDDATKSVSAPYNASASSGSNLGPTSQALADRLSEDVARYKQGNKPVPTELATASASGLDPHISPASALYQLPRVAAARGLAEADLRALVVSHAEGRALGLVGEPRINVLVLNLALDALSQQNALSRNDRVR